VNLCFAGSHAPDARPTSRRSRPNARDRARGVVDLPLHSRIASRWLLSRWLDRWGLEATQKWLRFNNSPAPLTLRANRLCTTRDRLAGELADLGVRTRLTGLAPDGLIVTEGHPLQTPLAGSGAFLVQDEASQLVAEVVGARPGERLLDACAAPGGKSLALAWSAPGGLVVACDVRPARVALLSGTLREHARRVGEGRAGRLRGGGAFRRGVRRRTRGRSL